MAREDIFCERQVRSQESKTGFLCLEHMADGIVPDCRYVSLQELVEHRSGEQFKCW